MGGGVDWGAMLRAALAMGISPDGFWRLSVVEWRWLCAVAGGGGAMGRAEMERLAGMWPD